MTLGISSGFHTREGRRTRMHTHTQTYTHANTHTCMHTHMHKYPCTCKHTHTYTCMHTHMHTYTNAHLHTHTHKVSGKTTTKKAKRIKREDQHTNPRARLANPASCQGFLAQTVHRNTRTQAPSENKM